MKVAVLSESPADEAAIRIIISGILGGEIEPIHFDSSIRARGWPGIKTLLPVIIPRLHYHSDAEALAIVVDSDSSTIHLDTHDIETAAGDCRLCDLKRVVAFHLSRLQQVTGREMLKIAIGLAVPAMEAWYVCLQDTHVNEAAWARHLGGERVTYTKNSLKQMAYGTERPSIDTETEGARNSARELIKNLDQVEELFPNGFGLFVQDIRGW